MVPDETGPPRVTVACQGGGSHTAFTAGVLDRLLSEERLAFDITGLTGTSGGAVCAFAAWFGLASDGDEEGRAKARRLLAQVWDGIAARDLGEVFLNNVGVATVRAQNMGVPIPSFSPYDTPASDIARHTAHE